MTAWRIAGINFDHIHAGDLLRQTLEHLGVEIVDMRDENPTRMTRAVENFQIPPERAYTEYRRCLAETRPDLKRGLRNQGEICTDEGRRVLVPVLPFRIKGMDVALHPFRLPWEGADQIGRGVPVCCGHRHAPEPLAPEGSSVVVDGGPT